MTCFQDALSAGLQRHVQDALGIFFADIVSQHVIHEFRTDDTQRNSYRISLARALWEVCRRCDDSILESELKSAIAAKAFTLRWSTDAEVKTVSRRRCCYRGDLALAARNTDYSKVR
eukprot:g27912.t1